VLDQGRGTTRQGVGRTGRRERQPGARPRRPGPRPPSRQRPLRLGVGAAVIFTLALIAAVVPLAPPRAEAHAVLVRADPPANSQLRQAPAQMTLYFSEAVERKVSTVRVIDANKKRVDAGIEFDDQDDALIRVDLNPLEPGYYTVIWETLSKVDGHRITGSYPITILKPDGSLPPGTNPNAIGQTATVSGTNAKPERVATKWLLLVAGSVLAGALAFTWVLGGVSGRDAEAARDAATTRIVATAAAALWVLAIAGFVDLLLQADLVYNSLGKFADVISGTRWGQRWLIRNVLVPPIAIGLVAFYRQRLGSRLSSLVVAALMALALGYLALTSMVSHAAAGRGSFWATASDFAHLVAASVWVGMLLQLALLVRWARTQLPRNQQATVIASGLRRFSLIAVVSIALLLFTGVVNTVIELNKVSDLTGTGYGRALLIKLVLVVPLLFAGGLNAYLFRPQVVEEAERAETGRRGGLSAGWEELEETLSRTLRIEGALALVVLLVVGVLVQLSPARTALAAPEGGKFTETKQADNLSITLNIDPNQPGDNTFEAYVTGAVDLVERIELRLLEQKKGAFESTLVLDPSAPPYFYVGRGPFINDPGKWRITASIRRSQGTDLQVPFDVKVTDPNAAANASRGGAFEAPRSLSAAAVALIAVSGLLSVGLVLASLDRPDRPAGVMGDLADRLAGFEIRPAFSLAALVVIGIGLGILLGAHAHTRLSGKAATKGNPVPATAESIARGKMLFEQNCTQCHGETGRGDGPLASTLRIPPANLYDHIPYHPDQFFFEVMTNGLGGVMPAFEGTLSEEDRWNILNYLRSQFGQPPSAQ
jgi:copper transport protein